MHKKLKSVKYLKHKYGLKVFKIHMSKGGIQKVFRIQKMYSNTLTSLVTKISNARISSNICACLSLSIGISLVSLEFELS